MSNSEQPPNKVDVPLGANPEVRVADLQGKVLQIFSDFDQKMKQTPTLDTFTTFLVDSDGVAALAKACEQSMEEVKKVQNSKIKPEQFEAFTKQIKEWSDAVMILLTDGALPDDPGTFTPHVESLRKIIEAIPKSDATIPTAGVPPAAPRVLATTSDVPAVQGNSQAAPKQSVDPKGSEKAKTPKEKKEKRAETLTNYFGQVKTGTELLEKIIAMPRTAGLQAHMKVGELERLSGDLYEKVLTFFVEFEAKKGKMEPPEMLRFGADFIKEKKIPSGCQTAIRDIVHADMVKKLEAILNATKPALESAGDPVKAKFAALGLTYRSTEEQLAVINAKTAKSKVGAGSDTSTQGASAVETTEKEKTPLERLRALNDSVLGKPTAEKPVAAETIPATEVPEPLLKIEEDYQPGDVTFSDLAFLEDIDIALVFSEFNIFLLAEALSDQEGGFQRKILSSLHPKVAKQVQDEIEAGRQKRTAEDISVAKKEILHKAGEMWKDGKIRLPKKEGTIEGAVEAKAREEKIDAFTFDDFLKLDKMDLQKVLDGVSALELAQALGTEVDDFQNKILNSYPAHLTHVVKYHGALGITEPQNSQARKSLTGKAQKMMREEKIKIPKT